MNRIFLACITIGVFAAVLIPEAKAIGGRGVCHTCAPPVYHAPAIVKAPDHITTIVFNNVSPPLSLDPRGDTLYGAVRAFDWQAPNAALIHDNVRRALDFASEGTIQGRTLDSEVVAVASIDAHGRAQADSARAFSEAFRAFRGEPQSRGVGFEQVTISLRNGKVEGIQRVDPLAAPATGPVEAPVPRAFGGGGFSCLKCHAVDGSAAAKFVIDDTFTLEKYMKAEAAIESGAMPPKSNLTPAEKASLRLQLGRLVPQ